MFKKKVLTAICTFSVFTCTNSTYERQYRRACKKTHTQSATLRLLHLLVLPPICHYTELPGRDAEKQKRHPGGCVKPWMINCKRARSCLGLWNQNVKVLWLTRAWLNPTSTSKQASSSNPACVQQPLVFVLLTFSGSQYVCCSSAPACTLSCKMNLCTQGQRKCTQKSTITIWLHNKSMATVTTQCVYMHTKFSWKIFRYNL